MDTLTGNGSDCNNTQSFDTSIKRGNIYQDPSENIFDLNYQKYPDRQLPNTQFEDYLNQTILPLAQTALREFGQSPDFASKMNLAFGNGFDRVPNRNQQLLDDLVKWKPVPFEILPGGQIRAKGAFGGDKIYLSEELLNPKTANPQAAVNVLLEEMGHYLDSQLNDLDAPGDEGAIFAKLVQNQPFAAGELAALQAENDSAMLTLRERGILTINGQEIEVEQASLDLDPGIFQVDSNGKISVDFLADAGAFQSQMAIFSLKGMEDLDLGSASFIQEAARRALSNSNLGRIVIKDAIEGAKFDGELGEANKNSGKYAGIKTFDFTPGDRLVIMLVPNGTVEEVFKNPEVDGNKRPLFSIASANPNQSMQLGQLVPGTFGWEDLRLNSSDADYNDLVFQLKGVTGSQTDLGQSIVSNNGKDWQSSPFAQKILNHVYQDKKPPILIANLAEDTGLSDRDRITSNPQVVGYLTDDSGIRKLQAKFEDGAYVDIFSLLKPDNSFSLGGKQLAHIKGDSLKERLRQRLDDGYYKLTLRAEDKFGNVSESIVKFTLDRTTPNFSLKGHSLIENSPANSVVGTFCIADANPGDNPNYSLVVGSGDTDNAAFEIVGNELRIKNSPDFETKSIYNIRVKTTDLAGLCCERMFTIDITNVNESPIALTLSENTLAENSLANSPIGTFSTTDPDAGDTHTYSLIAGTGDTDNAAFTLVGNELRIKNSPDFETKPTYNIRVKTTDAGGLSFEQTFTVNITNVNESPIALTLSGNTLAENSLANSLIGTFSTTDPDVGDTHTYSLIAGTGDTDNAAFTLVANELRIKNSPDFETKPTYNIRVKTTDAGGLSFEQTFTVNITNVNESPTALTLSGNTLAENSLANSPIGTFSTTDPDAGDTQTYSLIAGTGDTDNAAFTLVGNELRIKSSPDFETKPTYNIRVKTTDAGGLSFEQTFIVNITNVNESPIALTLSGNTLAENSLVNSLIGTFNTTDPDAGDSHTYSLVAGTGDTDNSAFTLVGKELRIVNSPDFETKPTYSIRVKTTDAGGLSFEQILAIDITNVNEAPINIALDKNSVLENALGAVISNITVTDPDAIAAFANNTVTVSDNRFEVVNNNGILQLKLKDGLSLDYETEPKVEVALTATDAGNSSLTYSKNFTIDVIDVDEKPPSVSALLTNDTGVSNSDRLTLDPTIKGQTINTIALSCSLNGKDFIDLTKALNPDGSFTISLEQYELLTNGSFPDGNYNLVLKGKNIYGNESPVATVNFTLDRTPPALTFDLAPDSDTGVKSDRITTERTVSLIGQTEAGLEVILVGTQQKVLADSTGKFTFTNVPMPVAGQAPFKMVTVDAAGNQGQVLNFLTREGINGAPKITSNPATVLDTTKEKTYTYQVAATDPDGDALTYSLLNSPQGAAINSSGAISFTPTGTLKPSYDFTVEVSDGRGGKDVQTFKVGLPGVVDASGIIRGTKWNDVNKNGVRDNQLVQGTNPDVIYVLDVSGSTDEKFVGSAIGDLNGDGLTDTRLDAEIAAFIALNKQLIKQGLGDKAQVAIIVFSGSAANADMGLSTAGVQLISMLGSDNNSNGTPDIEEILRSIRSGAFGVGNDTGTNPEAALQKVEQTFNTIATKDGNGNIIFLTDGEQNRGGSVADEVARLKAKGFNLSAFGVGDDASLSEIKKIDPDGIKFSSIDSIVNAFGGLGAGSESSLEAGLAGVRVYLDSNNNGVLDSGEPIRVTAADNPNTPNVDETGQYEFNNLTAGNYLVREIVPTGFEQTFPVNATTASPNFHTVGLQAGQVVENINFGNARLVTNQNPIITSTPRLEAVIGQPYEYPVQAKDPNGDPLTFGLNKAPTGMTIDPKTGLISYTPQSITATTVNFDTSNSQIRTNLDNQRGFTNDNQGFSFGDPITTSNYAIGEGFNLSSNQPLGPLFRSVVSFNLSSLTSPITAAKLQLQKFSTSGDPIETLGLFDVSTNPNTLYTSNYISPEIYADLGTGKNYGTFDVATGGSTTEILEFKLNEAAIADLNAAGRNLFSIGLSLLSTNPNNQNEAAEYLFARGGNTGIQRLVLETRNNETVEIAVTDGKGGQTLQNYDIKLVETLTNKPPLITSQPLITTIIGGAYEYQVNATDPNNNPLTYRLVNAPDKMTIDEFGKISWQPPATGEFSVAVEVNDGQGGIANQNYKITVGADTEAPTVNLGFNGTVIEVGKALNLQVAAQDNIAVKEIDLLFNGTPVALNPDLPDRVNNASITLNQVGVYEISAKATDTSGNVGTKNLKVRVIDPTDKDAPIVKFDLSKFDPLKPITDVTNIIGTINDPKIEFYRVEMAPVSSIDLNHPAANDADFIILAQGTGNVDNGILAQIDPRLYRNDNYYVRIYAQDYNGNINVQGTVLGISSETKPGEFSLEYTDLTIPLTGIPIEIKRVYHSLDAQVQGDFGYGWNLAMQDAQIQEASRDGRNLSGGNFEIGGNAFTVGTRVTLTTPDGRRVGYTFNPTVVGGSFFGTLYKPTFTPDPGVFDTLEVDDAQLTVGGDGSVGLPLFGFLGFNPSEYRLKTKEGIVYRYDQSKGLLDITDRNNNKLTYTDAGITSSTGQSITFKRDAQNRITEIIDPNGKSIKYSYDAKGDLNGVSDRNNANTQFEYENPRPHYLTEVVDPLGRSATRTEYDEQGRMKRLIDAAGNALDLSYTNGASSQTVKDPLGNNITRIFDKRGNVVEEIDQLGGVTKRTYDANDNRLSQTDPEGNVKSYTYDSRGNKLSETDGEGKTKLYTYNQTSKLLTETDALGNVTTYTYDANDNLTTRKDALGNTTTYKYATNGLLTEVVDANGKTSTFSYDGNGNLLELTDPTGAKTKFTYDGNGRVITNIDALGAITNSVYDAQGRLIEQADPEGSSCGCGRGITKVEYNAAGEKITEIDALGRRTEYRYNSRGLLIETILPDETPLDLTDNSRTKKEYDALDRVVVQVDELGRKTQHVYDKLGRKIEIILPDATPLDLSDNPRTKKEYDKAGRVIAEIDERGNRSTFTYDKADRLLTRTNALNEVTTYTYDADGRQSSMTDALGRKTTYAYDANDRLISTTYANNTTAAKTYDPLGRVIAETDLAGITTKYEYDALGRLTAVVDALNQRTEYKYDAVGNQIEQKDANSHVTKFEYDTLRRRKGMVLPGAQRKETIHNNIGNLIRETDANGVTTTYEYNARNWITKKSFSDGTPTETFTYTLTGQLATVTDNRGTTSYGYDERDRLLSRTEPDGRKIQYTYDLAGNILTLNAPSGTTSYTYDALNRIDIVTAPNLGKTDYTYDKVGNLTKTDFANGVTETQQYDLLNRLTNLENRNQTGITSSYTYTLDAMGNRTKVVEQDGRTVEYSYDPLYRLTQEKITDTVVGNSLTDYKFDPVGNRLERTNSVLGKTTYSYDVNDRLLQEVLGGKVTQYQYDAKGNLTAKIENGQTQAAYKWNARGELAAVEVTENGVTGRIEFEYDHDGIRVAIKQNGEETRFLIDNNQQEYAQVIEEYQPNGTVKTAYVHGWDLISQTNVSVTDYYQVDGLGSTRQLTNNTGAIQVEYDYDAYGNLTNKVGAASNNYLFAGEQFDAAVDGYYLRARYYDPTTGRFASTDPFEGYNDEPMTLPDYFYAGANPVNAIDPSGNISLAETRLLLTITYAFVRQRALLLFYQVPPLASKINKGYKFYSNGKKIFDYITIVRTH
jgi:RHS repeat-associated protein